MLKRLAMVFYRKKMTITEFWETYLKKTNQNPEDAVYSGELSFSERGITASVQLNLVLSGSKTAIFTPFETFQINLEPIPISGEVYVVTDSENEPKCIIEVTDVNVVPFNEISWELAQRDGENENLDEWREKMQDFIEEDAALCGFEAKPDTKIVCEIFRVIYRG